MSAGLKPRNLHHRPMIWVTTFEVIHTLLFRELEQ
jgi:hypothetical protein